MFEPFKLERYFAQYEFKARYMASSSDAESIYLKDLYEMDPTLQSKVENTWLGYTESTGLPELKDEISKLYQTVKHENILVHAGAQEPILNFYLSCLQAGDHVIVHTPCYQSHYSVPKSLGIEVSEWQASIESSWRPSLESLLDLIKPNTKAIFTNSPHNPTGFQWSKADFLKLIEIARSKNLILFSDEVYQYGEWNPQDRLPSAVDLYENAISLSALSKPYGLPGLRLGWIATHSKSLFQRIAAQKDYTTICNSPLQEVVAIAALKNKNALLKRNHDLVLSNWALTQNFLNQHQDLFDYFTPKGGTMVFPKAKPHFNVSDWSERLLQEHEVLLITGKHFDQNDQYFRLGLGRKNYDQVLKLLEKSI